MKLRTVIILYWSIAIGFALLMLITQKDVLGDVLRLMLFAIALFAVAAGIQWIRNKRGSK